jgi:hypothetical protein
MESEIYLLAYSLSALISAEKRSRLLPSARVVEKESGEWLAPVLQHADERAALEMLINLILPDEGQSDSINGGPDLSP